MAEENNENLGARISRKFSDLGEQLAEQGRMFQDQVKRGSDRFQQALKTPKERNVMIGVVIGIVALIVVLTVVVLMIVYWDKMFPAGEDEAAEGDAADPAPAEFRSRFLNQHDKLAQRELYEPSCSCPRSTCEEYGKQYEAY